MAPTDEDPDGIDEATLRDMERRGILRQTPSGWEFTEEAKEMLGDIMGLNQ